MTTNPNFRFEATLSEKGYSQKPIGVDYSTMKWKKKMISLNDFIDAISAGYSYCHIYVNNCRRKDKFLRANFVSIDVDDSNIDLFSFLNDCHLKPTFAYETFSNGKNGTYSYRLVFVFDQSLSKNAYLQMYDKLCVMTGLTNTKDHCGKILNQLMNGTNSGAYIFRSNIIYSPVTDLPVEATTVDQILEYRDALFTYTDFPDNSYLPNTNKKPSTHNSSGNYNIIPNIHSKQYNTKDQKWNTEEVSRFLHEVQQMGREGFLKRFRLAYKLIRWSKLEFNDMGYAVIPEGHLSLYVRYNRGKNGTVVNRFKDGEKRRNRLFIDGLIIRKIQPDITIYQLFYNLMHRVYFYYDNSDGILSDILIFQKAWDVMNYDMETVHFDTFNVGSVVTSRSYCINHSISRRSHSRVALKMEHYLQIKEWYDPSKSVSDNSRWA